MDAETSNLLTNGGLVLTGGMLMKLADVGFKAWLSRNQKTEITPDPLHITKAPKFVGMGEYNKHVADNTRDHENLFNRVGKVERDVAGLIASNNAQEKVLDRMAQQIDGLYGRIVLGGKKK